MNRLILKVVIILGFLITFESPWALETYKKLNDITFDENSVTMKLSGKTQYNVFKIESPPRIVVELKNIEYNFQQKEINVNSKYIKKIRSGQFQNKPIKIVRVVLDLNELINYELRGDNDKVVLILNPETQTQNLDNKGKQQLAVAQTETQQKQNTETNTQETSNSNISLEKQNSKEQQKEQETNLKTDTIKSETPNTTNIKSSNDSQIQNKKQVTTKQTNVQKTKNIQDYETPAPAKVTLPKTPVTLDFEEADIRDVLRILSIKSNINIIYGSDVSGTITLHLENVPFDKAFQTILSLKGLVSQEEDANIIRVSTPEKISQERSQAVTFTQIFPLNYSNANEVKANIDQIRAAEGRKGSTSIDTRTNSLIVTDTPEGLQSIKRIIAELDKKPYQVAIEAKLVEVTLTNNLDLGIQWQYAGSHGSVNIGQSTLETSDSAYGTDATIGGTVRTVTDPNSGGTGVTFPASPVSGQIGTISFGIVMDQKYLTGVLSALAQKGLSKILSNPRVTTLNNQTARILIGQRVPFTNTTIGAGGVSTTSTQWEEVGIKLEVNPTINSDERITMKIKPEVSLVTAQTAAGPVVASRQADTTVMIKNGETIVIGGLIREEDRKLGTMVPLLGEIPVIGHLFRRDYKTKERSELLVFITPQIIE